MDLSPPGSPKSHLQDVDNKILALKLYRNTVIPIAHLPDEILCVISSFLPGLSPSPLSHVFHRWREISLNLPCLWSHINFSELTLAGTAEMLARSKTAPLHLQAATVAWRKAKFEAFVGQIEAHIHHTRRLGVTAGAQNLGQMFGRLHSSAPFLEQLSIISPDSETLVIPDNLFEGMAPKLTYLYLDGCGIGPGSPLLKGLRDLKLSMFPFHAKTTLNAWLDALNQMPQLESLGLRGRIPIRLETLLVPVPGLTAVLPSLNELDIFASPRDCIVVLAHVTLPALSRLCVIAEHYHAIENTVARDLISCVARNACRPQDTEELQSLFIGDMNDRAETVAWTVPRQDDTCDGFDFLVNLGIYLARVAFSTKSRGFSRKIESLPHDVLLASLPLDHVASLTVKGRAPHCRRVWRRHAPKWHKLQRVRLFPTAVPAFREMLETAPRGDPLLPSLEELVLINVPLNTQKVCYLHSMLVKLMELEIPLTTLDLRTCIASDRAVQLLSGIVDDVRGPGDLVRKRGGNTGFIEEGTRERGTDGEEHVFDEIPLPLGSWDIDGEVDYDFADNGDSDSDSNSDLCGN